MNRLALVALVVLATGCHARFKKHASSLGEVRPQVLLTTGPSVQLGAVYQDDLVSTVVNVVQGVKSVQVANRLADAVDIQAVNDAFERSVVDTLGGGPPFTTTDAEGGPLLQVEVVKYGLTVPALGAPGEFEYDIRVRIYDARGDRVYSTSQSCAVGAGDPNAVSLALGTVNNVKQLEQMTDGQITDAFVGAAAYCGAELVRRMRKHAG